MKTKYDDEIAALDSAIEEIQKKIFILKELQPKDMIWMRSFAEHYCHTDLTRQMLIALVDTIYVGRDKTVKIQFKYQDEFERLSRLIEESQCKEETE